MTPRPQPAEFIPAAHGWQHLDADTLERNGYRIVRSGIAYHLYAPSPDPARGAFLAVCNSAARAAEHADFHTRKMQ